MRNIQSQSVFGVPHPLWKLGDGAPPEDAFIALVPGAKAPLISLELPTALKGVPRMTVARRQILDRIGSGYLLCLHPDWTRALVVSEVSMSEWCSSLGTASSRCKALLPDYLALPVVLSGWCVAVASDGLQVRLGPDDGFSAERDLALIMLALELKRARAEGKGPLSALRIGPPDPELEALLADVPPTHEGIVFSHGESALDLLRDRLADASGLELRIKRYLWAALLVMFGALGWVVAEGIVLARDRSQTVVLNDAVVAAVRRDLIPNEPIVDLQVQVNRAIEARLQAANARTADPLNLLRRAAVILARGEIQALTLNLEGLRVDLRLPDFATLDTMLNELNREGLRVEVQRSGIENVGISAALVLQEVP